MPHATLEGRRAYHAKWLAKQTPQRLEELRAAKLAKSREYRVKNKDLLRQKGKAYVAKKRADDPQWGNSRSRKWWQENQDYRLMRKYGITAEHRDAMLTQQGNCCMTCRSTTPKSKYGWQVDHCHTTGKVRGILCLPCNLVLGKVKDSPSLLRTMASYIEGAL